MSDRTPMEGFPPPRESQVNLGNWQEPPFNRWSFQHLREVIPTQRIARGLVARPLDDADDPLVPDDVAVTRFGSGSPTISGVLADTWTDAVLALHDGRVVLERYFGGMRADTRHLLMSVSKSVVGCVTGILVDQGRLDTDVPITRYVPEIAGSGYDGATVRHLLDMRTGVAFSEVYQDPDAEVRVIERHMGWRPDGGSNSVGMYAYLASLGAKDRTAARSSTARPTRTCSAGSASEQPGSGWPIWSRACSGGQWAPSTTPRSPVTASVRPSMTAASPQRRAMLPGSANCCSRTDRRATSQSSPSGGCRSRDTSTPTSEPRSPPPTQSRSSRGVVPEPVLVHARPVR